MINICFIVCQVQLVEKYLRSMLSLNPDYDYQMMKIILILRMRVFSWFALTVYVGKFWFTIKMYKALNIAEQTKQMYS